MRTIARKLIVMDFETDGLDPLSCNPTQLAAIVVDLKRLEIVPDSEFNVVIRPDEIDSPTYHADHKKTIEFHSKIMGIPEIEVIERWRAGTPEKDAFTYYDNFLMRHSPTIDPVVGGQNVRDFDLPIYKRCIEKYKIPYRFYKREKMELLDFFSHWFLFAKKPPVNYKLDTIRKKFGMSLEGAHDALVDVRDTAEILLRFLKLHQTIIPKVKSLYE